MRQTLIQSHNLAEIDAVEPSDFNAFLPFSTTYCHHFPHYLFNPVRRKFKCGMLPAADVLARFGMKLQ